jgi:sugar phosphate permease
MIAQISVFSGIPLTYVIFLGIAPGTSALAAYLILGTLTGFLISWCAPGCNNVIFSKIFEPEIRGSVYSVDRVFEGSASSLGTVFIGIAATAFGFVTPPAGSREPALLNASFRVPNMMALGVAMFWVAFIPWIICLILYTLVYFTYPQDAERMRKLLEERTSENQAIETGE